MKKLTVFVWWMITITKNKMSSNAIAKLFFGVVLTQVEADALLAKAMKTEGYTSEDQYELLAKLFKNIEDASINQLVDDYRYHESEKYAVSLWSVHAQSWDLGRIVQIPNQEEMQKLNHTWHKVAKEIGVDRQPEFILHATYG